MVLKVTKDVDKAKILAPILYNSFNKSKNGIFGHKEMPEDLLPAKITKGSFEHIMFITMCASIDYQRDAIQLWNAGRKTMEDDETSWVFNPNEVIKRSDKDLINAMKKYNLSKKDVKDAIQIWKPISLSLHKLFEADPRNLFTEYEYDALRIYDALKGHQKSYFPYLSGNKILPLWIRMIHDVVDINFKNISKIPIPVDRHIARATFRFGCVKGIYSGDISGIFQIIDSVWAEACKDLPYYRLQLDQPLWHLSKYGCVYKKDNTCPKMEECPVSKYCINGIVSINDQGIIKLNTEQNPNNKKVKKSNKFVKYNYKWCPETGALWTACNCNQCIERRKGLNKPLDSTKDEKPIKIENAELLWRDIKKFVEKRIENGKTTMYTKKQGRTFWLISSTNSYMRVKRDKSKLSHEDIPKNDFIDIWKDLHNPKYISKGYTQKDLHGGQNRHTAVSFSLISNITYIETKEFGKSLRYYLKKIN